MLARFNFIAQDNEPNFLSESENINNRNRPQHPRKIDLVILNGSIIRSNSKEKTLILIFSPNFFSDENNTDNECLGF